MRTHVGGIVGVLAALSVLPLSCRDRRPKPLPLPITQPAVKTAPVAVVLRPVRVLLAGNAAEVPVGIPGPCDVRSPSVSEALEHLDALPASLVRPTAVGFRMGNREYPGPILELVPAAGGLVTVDGRRYRGWLRLVLRPGSTFHVINVVPLEPYLASVINGEMPSTWPAEALKAQAVAARTYALYQMEARSPSALYDVRPDQWSQMYLGLASETDRSRRLVAEANRIVLTYKGRLICTYYSSTCGGHTQDSRHVFENPPIPPLAGVSCPYCAGSKYSRWQRTISMRDLTTAVGAALERQGRSVGEVTALQVLKRAASGHVARIKVLGTSGSAEMSGKAFRHAVGTRRLPSTRFQVSVASGGLRFAGGGFGHGVGMCQYGAKGAAEAGLDFRQILQYYYAHSTAVRVPASTNPHQRGSGRAAAGRQRPGASRAGSGGRAPEARGLGDS